MAHPVRKYTYGLIQDPRHAVNQELKVLWPVQPAEEVSEEVFRGSAVARLRYWVQYQNK